jgi:hypothetical protein
MRVHRAAGRACPAGRRAPSNGSLSANLGITHALADIHDRIASVRPDGQLCHHVALKSPEIWRFERLQHARQLI